MSETAVPTHLGVVMDGNRRWARAAGHASASAGHRVGAQHVEDLLGWCAEAGIEHLTTYVLSADNIRKRSATEVQYLFDLLTGTLPDLVMRSREWSLHVAGDLALLPGEARTVLTSAVRDTAGRPRHLTMAIAYDGRADIVDAVRAAIRAGHDATDPAVITGHLGGGPRKEVDLVIRTSGEHRLSGFLPWQTAHAEVVVSDKAWPAFAREDFEAALRMYGDRVASQ
ncbi:polyprenyl diphosphate synthase [Nocardioides currus]|uniref:Isoprenyl transferase n=1 Tax=Nocardioides currus TaxID=2133958 RepID=A0A2R7Z1D7_9ACTN|nr:polyprenyl diphosphate synthase [Nocardioides currus]PUA81959.1 di-trans,poly-cis-decaprenylcistransferase [Nocardioides currus]